MPTGGTFGVATTVTLTSPGATATTTTAATTTTTEAVVEAMPTLTSEPLGSAADVSGPKSPVSSLGASDGSKESGCCLATTPLKAGSYHNPITDIEEGEESNQGPRGDLHLAVPQIILPDHHDVPDPGIPRGTFPGKQIRILAEVVLKTEPDSASEGSSEFEILEETSFIEVSKRSGEIEPGTVGGASAG